MSRFQKIVKNNVNRFQSTDDHLFLLRLTILCTHITCIRNKRLQWAEHAWRNQNALLRTTLEKNPTEKKTHRKTEKER
jgi:hypothetical protein